MFSFLFHNERTVWIMYQFMWLTNFFALQCRLDFKTISWPHSALHESDFRQFLHTFLSDYLSCQPCTKLIHHKIILFSNTYLSKEEFIASRNRLWEKISHNIESDGQVESWHLSGKERPLIPTHESVKRHIAFNSI